jgi:hypothetical protein
MSQKTTLCLTAGGRPDLLDQTLKSLLSHNRQFFSDFCFVNDFGDDETNRVIFSHVPQARLFSHAVQKGHHYSIDEMYASVETPFIFHCEDDWLFDPVAFIPACFDVLLSDKTASQVTVRDADCQKTWEIFPEQVTCMAGDQKYQKSRSLSINDWGHYSFNPSLLRKDLWLQIGPFQKFYKERDINDACMAKGLTSARLVPGVCRHIGDGRHMIDTARKKDMRTALHRLYRSIKKRTERFL